MAKAKGRASASPKVHKSIGYALSAREQGTLRAPRVVLDIALLENDHQVQILDSSGSLRFGGTAAEVIEALMKRHGFSKFEAL